MTSPRVLLVHRDRTVARRVGRCLAADGVHVERIADGADVLAVMGRGVTDAVLLADGVSGPDVGSLLRALRRSNPHLPIVMLAADADPAKRGGVMQLAPVDCVVNVNDAHRLRIGVRAAIERARTAIRLDHLERQISGHGPGGLLGTSPPMMEVYRRLTWFVGSEVNVVVVGESGTGKRLVARAMHDQSARASGPFVTFDCAAMKASNHETELFGPDSCADDRDIAPRSGCFGRACTGTLFLHGVAELSRFAQARLLRVLHQGSRRHVDGTRPIRSDVRVISSTRRDLRAEVKAGRFCEDLYSLLAVDVVDVPPLRARGDDLLMLALHFLSTLSNGRIPRLADGAVDRLQAYGWPDNVRELQTVMRSAAALARDGVVRPHDLPPVFRVPPGRARRVGALSTTASSGARYALNAEDIAPLADIERAAILHAIEVTEGNLSSACRALGIGRTTLYRKLEQYRAQGISIPGDVSRP